jgi:hypothetical protein
VLGWVEQKENKFLLKTKMRPGGTETCTVLFFRKSLDFRVARRDPARWPDLPLFMGRPNSSGRAWRQSWRSTTEGG